MATKKMVKAAAPAPKVVRKAKREVSGSLNGARARDREVIDAAVKIFWEKGYASSSVQDLADALGMLKGSLYYYIDSKESVLDRIFEDSHADLVQLTKGITTGTGPVLERLTRFLHDYAMWTLTHLERAGLYSREWRHASDGLRASLAEQQRYYDRSLRTLIKAGQDEGALESNVDPRIASQFIWASFTGIPDWYRPNAKNDANAVADMYVELALRACGAQFQPVAGGAGNL